MPTIYKFSDADAIFISVPNGTRPGITVQWPGSGREPHVIPLINSLEKYHGAKVITGKVADLCPGLWNQGALPAAGEDSKHVWTGSEFAGGVPAPNSSVTSGNGTFHWTAV